MNIQLPSAKVAIVVPCYNHGSYLGDCLNSVTNQTFSDWVCVIVDDGSKDNSGEVSNNFCQQDARFRYLRQRNLGLSKARNNGINSCKSEYILPLDADDMIAPTYLEKTIAEFNKNPETKLVYTDCHLFGLVDQKNELPEYSFKLLLQRNIITATAVYRREDFVKTPGYDPNLKVGSEDWDYWLSLLDQDSVVIKVHEMLFEYRQRENSMVKRLNSEQIKSIRRYVYYKHIDKYLQFPEDPEILTFRIKILEKEVRDLQRSNILMRIRTKLLRTRK